MNEAAAREITLVRAIETTDSARTVWSDEDRAWAARAAAEVVGTAAPADAFLARRAALVVERLGARHPMLPKLLRAFTWRRWVGPVVALIAFALGAASDRLGPAHRVDVLAFPLLALIAWNLAVYVVIVLQALMRLVRRSPQVGPLRRLVGRLGRATPQLVPPAAGGGALGTAAAVFGADWARLAAPLWTARVARVLHIAAAMLALGALAGLYMRGVAFEYRAGWESTFLDAGDVQRLLSVVLAPGSALTGIPLPDVARLEAIRFGAGGTGENAAPWIHLYAATVGVLVVLPRLILAALCWLVEGYRASRWPLPLSEPYFQRLLQGLREAPMRVRVLPYSLQPTDAEQRALDALLERVFGSRITVVHAAPTAYGREDAVARAAPSDASHDATIALFSLSATPEDENHGAFVGALAAAPGGFVVIVDESAFRSRFADQPRRIDERRDAWRHMLAAHRLEPVFIDLGSPDHAAAAAALEAALEHRRHA